jgi:hypothetical protein
MYTDMNLNNSLEAPTNTKQIKNAKYRDKKRTTQPTNNIADEILAVINMTSNHPYVQQMIHTKDQIPNAVACNEPSVAEVNQVTCFLNSGFALSAVS